MRELQLVKWCDVCYLNDPDGGEPVPATQEWTIGIVPGDTGRPAPKVLDLCETHAGPIADLAALMGHIHQIAGAAPVPAKKMVGRPRKDPDAPMKERPMVVCPVCRDELFNNVLVAHIWSQHRDDDKPPVPRVCPECGSEQFDSSQAMATHRRLAHGYDAVADALSGVKGYRPPKVVKARKIKAIESAPVEQPELTEAS